ncbi:MULTISPECIES: hypothetical protein [Corynebacterium]|uniref:Uncharacterized protein n=1 Tax=Corynebacterium timonense TaxID=441500 RepID=A0A1H1U875_9CORY|nr:MULTISPECIES: hypothetical protein [Corynebacterium]WJY66991.1 hypothetical protein CAURIS_00215 [Corynebacterium auris]SDS68029.1 hypothetical protein SAMN04488539_2157 [Corynebacterium timonense]
MRAIQYLLALVIIAAGVISTIMLLELIPATRDLLPGWVADWLPSFDSPGAAWLIAAAVTVIVAAAFASWALQQTIERQKSVQQ